MREKRSISAGSTVVCAESAMAALDPYGAHGVYTPLSSRSMARIVLKFGGTSVGDIDRIRNAARKVKAEVDRGNEVAVVVVGHVGRHQPAGEMGQRDRALARCPRIRRRGGDRRAGDDRPAGDGAAAAGREGALLDVVADPDPHRRGPRQGAHRRHRDGRHGARHGGGRGADRAGLPGPVARGPRDDAWAAAAPTPRRWRWRRRSRPTAATSTPTSTASTRPIPGSSRRRARSTR